MQLRPVPSEGIVVSVSSNNQISGKVSMEIKTNYLLHGGPGLLPCSHGRFRCGGCPTGLDPLDQRCRNGIGLETEVLWDRRTIERRSTVPILQPLDPTHAGGLGWGREAIVVRRLGGGLRGGHLWGAGGVCLRLCGDLHDSELSACPPTLLFSRSARMARTAHSTRPVQSKALNHESGKTGKPGHCVQIVRRKERASPQKTVSCYSPTVYSPLHQNKG